MKKIINYLTICEGYIELFFYLCTPKDVKRFGFHMFCPLCLFVMLVQKKGILFLWGIKVVHFIVFSLNQA